MVSVYYGAFFVAVNKVVASVPVNSGILYYLASVLNRQIVSFIPASILCWGPYINYAMHYRGGKFRNILIIKFALPLIMFSRWACNDVTQGVKLGLAAFGSIFDTNDSLLLYACLYR